MKRALITGITGQDGSYLAELLLEKGYEVHGIVRRTSNFGTSRIDALYRDPHESGVKLFLHYGDLCDAVSLRRILERVQPDEVYNLAAQSHVWVSFEVAEATANVTAVGALRLLSALVETKIPARFYQASSSEMFGKVTETPQREMTPFYPRSPYGCAKTFAHFTTVNFREAYDLHASSGILFNHESPRRGETFVTRKITRGLARILSGKQQHLYLGNLDAKRDWGYAKDYVRAMWMMLQVPTADDYIIAMNESHSVREFVELAFSLVGLDWKDFVKTDPRYYRPSEVDLLQGDASKAWKQLGWKPTTSFQELVRIMVDADLRVEGVNKNGLGAPSGAQIIHAQEIFSRRKTGT